MRKLWEIFKYIVKSCFYMYFVFLFLNHALDKKENAKLEKRMAKLVKSCTRVTEGEDLDKPYVR